MIEPAQVTSSWVIGVPRSRGPDVAQKPLARGLTSSDSDPPQRFVRDRSPRLGGDRPSLKGLQSDQKKLGTRIADLESQLGLTQLELRNFKGPLASAKASKKEAQEKLLRKSKKSGVLKNVKTEVNQQNEEMQELCVEEKNKPIKVIINEQQLETDVFEVPQREIPDDHDQCQKESKETSSPPEISETIKLSSFDMVSKDDEISFLKDMLERKEDELKLFSEENIMIKKELAVAKAGTSLAQSQGNEMASKLILLGEELQASRAQTTILNEKLVSMERAKASLESVMKQMRVQTEQWRKAADAAAAVLRIQERMSKHFPESPLASTYAGSPGMGNDDVGSGPRRGSGSGIRIFGDLWKKKGHK